MKEPQNIMRRPRESRGYSVDGIFTHCGFREPRDLLSSRAFGGEGGAALVNRMCDSFMEKRDYVWVASVGDYLKSDDAFMATAALRQ